MSPRSFACLALLIMACQRASDGRSAASAAGTSSPATQNATAWSPEVPGHYGQVGVSPVTGDVGGIEIEIQCPSSECVALVTMAEGAPEPAVRAPATVRDTTVEIRMRDDSRLRGMGVFRGVVTNHHLIGEFSNGFEVDLSRH